MKKLIYSLAAAMLAFTACTEETITYFNPEPGEEPTTVVAELGISSENTWFSAEDDRNAAVAFKSIGGKVAVDITTNVLWSFSKNGDWLTIEADTETDRITLICESNKETEMLTGSVTITAGDKTATIDVTQNAYGTLEIAVEDGLNNLTMPAVGELTTTLAILSSYEDWTFETVACPWLLVEKDGDDLILTLEENETYEDRETVITLIAGAGAETPATEQIRISQDRAVLLTSSALSVPFTGTPVGEREITIETNFGEWTYQVEENDWLTVTETGSGLKFKAEPYGGEQSRSVTVTVTAGDGLANMKTLTISVSQTGFDPSALIIGLNVGVNESSVLNAILPFDQEADVTIDWGDGTIENFKGTYPTHAYENSDYYIVSVKGSVPSLNAGGSGASPQKHQLTEIFNWGKVGLRSLRNAFMDCKYLERIATDDIEAFAEVTSFENAFRNCYNLEAIPEGLFEYATQATTFIYTFGNAGAISADNVNNRRPGMITKLPEGLFKNCVAMTNAQAVFASTSLTEVDEDLFANCPELTDASQVFTNTYLTTVPAGLFANNPKITTFNALFSTTATLTSIPEGFFDNNPLVTSFRQAFLNTSLESVPAGLFKGKDKCTDFRQVLSFTKITSLPEDLFEGCSAAVQWFNGFSGCAELETIPSGLFTKSGAQAIVTSAFYGMFNGCSSLKAIPAGLLDGFDKVTSFNDFFNGCSSLQSIPEGLFATNTAVTSFSNVFKDCTSLTAIPDNMLSGLVNVTSFSSLFSGCTGLEKIGKGIFDGCAKVTNISSMFQNCTSLTTIDPEAFTGASAITTITSLFNGCTALTTVPADVLAPLTNATTATTLFANSGITTIPAGLFAANTKITNYEKAFNLCPELVTVPDGLFGNITATTNCKSLFDGCVKLAGVGKPFGPSTAAIDLTLAFANCPSLKTLTAGVFDGLTNGNFTTAFKSSGIETLPSGLFATAGKTYTNCFQDCKSLKAVPAQLFGTDNTNATALGNLFNGCSNLTTIDAGAFVGLKAPATNVSNLFANCTSLQSVPSGLFATNTTISTYASMFTGCSTLTTVGTGIFNCSYGTTALNGIFTNCKELTTIPTGLFINPENVTTVASMFSGCSKLQSVPADFFSGMTAITALGSLFNGCASLQNVSADLFDGMVNVTGLASLFNGCSSLQSIPAGLFEGMTKVTAMGSLFNGCSSITTVPAGIFDGMINIAGVGMTNMFQNCVSLKSIPEGIFAGITKPTSIANMFSGCTELESVPASLFDDMALINIATNAFLNCSSLSGESPYKTVAGVKYHLYDRTAENAVASGLKSVDGAKTSCFAGCTGLSDYNSIPSAWK